MMEIRFAKECDIPQMLDLLQQVGAVHHQLRPDLFRSGAQKYDENDLKELLKDPARPIFAACLNGKMVGYAFCILQETKGSPVLCDRRVVYIDDLCIDEHHRGSGIAKALYQRVVEYAREGGFDAVTLNVWSGNSAEGFYKAMGMQPQKVGMEFILER